MEIVGVIALALVFLFFLSLLTGGQTAEDRQGAPFQLIIQQVPVPTEERSSSLLIMFVLAFLLLIVFVMMQAP